MLTSGELQVGSIYTRADLRQQFGITDQTINNGVFKPQGHDSVWLFITEQKSSDMTPYRDQLVGNTLQWQGQLRGRTDSLIIEHAQRGLELLVFYRMGKSEFQGGGFRYLGRFQYKSHSGGEPTSFVLERIV
jgi:putative restriction endonuclease